MHSILKETNTFESTQSLFSIELLGQLFDQAPDSLMVADKNGKLLMINRRAQMLFGYSNKDVVGANIGTIIPSWSRIVLNGSSNQTNAEAICKSSDALDVELTLNIVTLHKQKFIMVAIRNTSFNYAKQLTLESDNKKLKKRNYELENLSNTDPLSGLLNRRGLEKVLIRESNYSKRTSTVLLAALIDLDDFKIVNDTYGHASGDRVLREVTQILKKELRSIDWMGRVGGDEFLVFLPCTTLLAGASVAERVRLALHQTAISIESYSLYLTASMGIVSLPSNVVSIDQVLELTKASLKASKNSGKNCVTVDDGRVKKPGKNDSNEIKSLLSGFGRSVAQPILNLKDERTMGFEILSRGPQGFLEMPDEFFRVSDENNILTLMDLRCLKLAIEFSKVIPQEKGVHINIFPSTLADVPVNKLIELVNNGSIKENICFEISGKRLMTDSSRLTNQISKLKSNGIQLAFDDIGFGFTALEAILLFEPEFIKIDGRCIRNIDQSKDSRDFVNKLTKVAKAVNAKTIAEQIETRNELLCLQELEVDYGQGWLWGVPQ